MAKQMKRKECRKIYRYMRPRGFDEEEPEQQIASSTGQAGEATFSNLLDIWSRCRISLPRQGGRSEHYSQ